MKASIASLRPCFRTTALLNNNRHKTSQRCNGNDISTILSREKSTVPSSASSSTFPDFDQIYNRALDNSKNFDHHYNYTHEPLKVHQSVKQLIRPMRPNSPLNSNPLSVPNYIPKPPYAYNGSIPHAPPHVILQDKDGIEALRKSGRIARMVLDKACSMAKPGVSTDEINASVHQWITDEGAYPSPLNYAGFPKSLCSSINEVVCHGIPDQYKLQKGDVASFDVSCFFEGYHGDNCATVLVGDHQVDEDDVLSFESNEEEQLFITGRRLIQATQEALDMGVSTCRPGNCLTDIGAAISSVADAYGYDSVQTYRGHGIGRDFHCPPFVKHYRNEDFMELKEGMVFTIEPMLTEGRADSAEWQSDGWTVVTRDGGRSAQFEHMVSIKPDGAEILTLPS